MSVADRVGPGPGEGPAEPVRSFEQIQSSPEFVGLKNSFRRVIFPVTALFLLWFFTYVLLAAFAQDFMATKVVGNINVGLLLGLAQFVTTFAITMGYRRWADRQYDPAATSLRERIEASAGARTAGGHR